MKNRLSYEAYMCMCCNRMYNSRTLNMAGAKEDLMRFKTDRCCQ